MKKKIQFARHKTLYIGNPRLDYLCNPVISANVGPNCADPIINGVAAIVRLINKSDILGYVDDGTTPIIKTAITLDTGKKFFQYEGTKISNNAKFETVEKGGRTFYSHQVDIEVGNASGVAINQYEKLVANGEIVALVKYLYEGTAGETKWQIYGPKQGLKGTLSRDQQDGDSGGAFKISLKTDPKFLEPNSPSPFFITDMDTTDALVVTYTTA